MGSFAVAVVALSLAGQAEPGGDPAELFERSVRPVLVTTCLECHGRERVERGLRLDRRESLLSGGRSGPAIVPGEPEESLLIHVVRGDHPELRMPPPPREPLDPRIVGRFERWVEDGAVWPEGLSATAEELSSRKRWAFEPVRKPAIPEGESLASPIDRFIARRLDDLGLAPAPPADRRTLIRRATFDLIGLPPAPEEVERFLADDAPDAFARVVDRLLASPRYGERWGRHWLDLARYADTLGDGSDTPVPEARLYRDYVIEAFNGDLPYDEFVIEQIAGDILAFEKPEVRFRERIIATGFIALSRQFGNSAYADIHLVIENTIDTIGKSMLGMTLACARCHDHKFDPITQEDYYGLYGYFSSTRYPHAGTEHTPARVNFVPLTADRAVFEKYLELDERRSRLARDIKRGNGDSDQLRKELADVAEKVPDVEVAWAVIDRPEGTGDAKIQTAGDPRSEGRPVPRGFIDCLTPADAEIAEGRSGRLELARWIASPENPLTARVITNRIWQYHFGRGIVLTSSTFGAQGEPPTHPDLLDWLADRFVRDGWSVKKLHRRILLSDAYRRSSRWEHEGNLAEDPDNRWYWRYPRRRLEAEPIRDAVLRVSGSLDLSWPGPHPFPEHDRFGRVRFTQHRPFTEDYDHRHRSVYLMSRRLGQNPYLALFNGPGTNESTARREVSTVPLQSLFWMNSAWIHEQAEAFAERLIETTDDRRRRIRLGHELAYGRPAAPEEERAWLEYIRRYEAASAGSNGGGGSLEAWSSFCRVLISSSEFLYVD